MRVRWRASVGLLAAGGALLTGCGDGDKPTATGSQPPASSPAAPQSSAPASPSPSPSTPSPEAVARDAVMKAYLGAQNLFTQIQQDGKINKQDVNPYLADSAKGEWVSLGLRLEQGTFRYVGEPTRDPRIAQLALADAEPHATVEDCVDISTARRVDKVSGEVLPRSQDNLRYPQIATLAQRGGVWLVTKLETKRDQTC